MRKKTSVPIPEKKMAVFGSKPIIIGPRTVAPNIASTCCNPTKMDCPQGSLSSGAIIPSFLRDQRGKYPCFSAVAMTSVLLRTKVRYDGCSVEQSRLHCPDKTRHFLRSERKCYS